MAIGPWMSSDIARMKKLLPIARVNSGVVSART